MIKKLTPLQILTQYHKIATWCHNNNFL